MQPGIFRNELPFDQGYVSAPTNWVRDPNISLQAKGLLVYLMSHKIGYTITRGQIIRESAGGRNRVDSAIQELVTAGYLQTEKTRRDDGRNGTLAFTICNPEVENQPLEIPDVENPQVENPQVENQPAIVNNLIKNINTKEINHSATKTDFDLFWSLYPRKVGKGKAREVFFDVCKAYGVDVVLAGVQRLAADPNLPETQFVPHPTTWLRREGWDDEPYPADEKKSKTVRDEWYVAPENRSEYLPPVEEN